MTEAMPPPMPGFQQYGLTTGGMTPRNYLFTDWAKSRDPNPVRDQRQMMPPPARTPAEGEVLEGSGAPPAA